MSEQKQKKSGGCLGPLILIAVVVVAIVLIFGGEDSTPTSDRNRPNIGSTTSGQAVRPTENNQNMPDSEVTQEQLLTAAYNKDWAYGKYFLNFESLENVKMNQFTENHREYTYTVISSNSDCTYHANYMVAFLKNGNRWEQSGEAHIFQEMNDFVPKYACPPSVAEAAIREKLESDTIVYMNIKEESGEGDRYTYVYTVGLQKNGGVKEIEATAKAYFNPEQLWYIEHLNLWNRIEDKPYFSGWQVS